MKLNKPEMLTCGYRSKISSWKWGRDKEWERTPTADFQVVVMLLLRWWSHWKICSVSIHRVVFLNSFHSLLDVLLKIAQVHIFFNWMMRVTKATSWYHPDSPCLLHHGTQQWRIRVPFSINLLDWGISHPKY